MEALKQRIATAGARRNVPSLIEKVWPVQKISVEAQKERKANLGQTLTGLGSYWKGRKPLILARACVLGALLPSTGDEERDLAIFEMLMGMAESQVDARFKVSPTIEEIEHYGEPEEIELLIEAIEQDGETIKRLKRIDREERIRLMCNVVRRMPYSLRVTKLLRPEEVSEDSLIGPILPKVAEQLGESASSLSELIEALGQRRFGRRPRVADTFAGGGSLPFEAARLGADVYASDLNPIACLLTWGALHVIGTDKGERKRLEKAENRLISAVADDIVALGIEEDENGNRAKAYLYCVEARCPQTGWMVPLATSWAVSKSRNVIARLVPDYDAKRFEIEIVAGVSSEELAEADKGTVRDGKIVYSLGDQTYSTPIKTLRGDRTLADGSAVNSLRPWTKEDFAPRADDIFQERLYCIQWITKDSLDQSRQQTFFAAPTKADREREEKVADIVRRSLANWQAKGLVPDMPIELGDETTRLVRERGWTYWHHVFTPRDYILVASVLKHVGDPELLVAVPSLLNHASKMCQWITSAARKDPSGRQLGGPRELPNHVFYNQALNTFWNYASRASSFILRDLKLSKEVPSFPLSTESMVACHGADKVDRENDVYITDPPYADAVNYHEITEFFISWCRGAGRRLFPDWTWDARRALAIKGDGDDFRKGMVEAYRAMAKHMPDNGLQIVMFTHQDAGVWADMAQIFWGAGLQVMAAWYIATETTSELKKGGYVQGTVVLVLRKRAAPESGYKDEIVQEVKAEVAEQIDTMTGLNQKLKGHGRIENLFEDADLQMAGYAAALRVLTRYAKIDGIDMTMEALRSGAKGEKRLIAEVIDFAVQVANEHMVPDGMPPATWERLTGSERFYFKMIDVETTAARKLDNYQNFAKAFRVSNYSELMGSLEPNKARLKTAAGFKKSGFEIADFGASSTRAMLYAIYEIETDVDGEDVLAHLRDLVPGYMTVRDDLMAITNYVAKKRAKVDEAEARAAGILYGLIRNERLG
jgi:adenine-specific DNA methylase